MEVCMKEGVMNELLQENKPLVELKPRAVAADRSDPATAPCKLPQRSEGLLKQDF